MNYCGCLVSMDACINSYGRYLPLASFIGSEVIYDKEYLDVEKVDNRVPLWHIVFSNKNTEYGLRCHPECRVNMHDGTLREVSKIHTGDLLLDGEYNMSRVLSCRESIIDDSLLLVLPKYNTTLIEINHLLILG